MGKKYYNRWHVMKICKAVFNFDEYRIKPCLDDICVRKGYSCLSYNFVNVNEIPSRVDINILSGQVTVHIWEGSKIDEMKLLSFEHYRIDYDNWFLMPIYKSKYSAKYPIVHFNEEDRIYL